MFRAAPEGHLVHDARTVARNEGTRILAWVRPWANTTEIQIYLAGFHAGEQFVLGNLDTQSPAVFESSWWCASSFLKSRSNGAFAFNVKVIFF